MPTPAALIFGNTDLTTAVERIERGRSRAVYTTTPQSQEPVAWAQSVRAVLDAHDVTIEALILTPAARSAQIGDYARGAVAAVEEARESLIASGRGRIVVVGGRDWLGWPGRVAESADLSALVGLTRSLALELGVHGVTANLICPVHNGDAHPQAGTGLWDQPPQPLTGNIDVEDVAFAVGFAADPASGYFTGQILHVSGGLHALSSLTA